MGVMLAPRTIAAHPASIGRCAARCLLEELRLHPKPGLVSLIDTGSHTDMHAGHFARSAFALRRQFTAFAAAGAKEEDFAELRRIGVAAEVAMLRATGGVNTHRGAIFSLGLLSAAAGTGEGDLGACVRRRWGNAIGAHRRDPASHGSRASRTSGIAGAQAEAASGFPSIFGVALPAYRAAIRARATHHDAAVQAFFALLAHVQDTNLLHRGGMEGLLFAQRSARAFLDDGGILAPDGASRALALHREFVARRLSPGGSADLVAAMLLVVALERG